VERFIGTWRERDPWEGPMDQSGRRDFWCGPALLFRFVSFRGEKGTPVWATKSEDWEPREKRDSNARIITCLF
jgi:hypothetical protein